MRCLLLLIVCLGSACATSHEPVRPVETPTTVSRPPATEAPACALLVRTEVQPAGPGRFRLVALAENASTSPLRFELPDRCPNGPVVFEGLGAAYDYYNVCAAGACPGVQAPHRFEIAAGAKQELGSTFIDVKGEPPCTKLLPMGTYTIGVVMPDIGVPTCVTKGVLQVKADMLVPPPNPPPAPHPTPHRVSAPPIDPRHRCEQPSDCTLSCPNPPGCCSNPCGCKNAINRKFVEQEEKDTAKNCLRPPKCPAYGCAYEPAFGATCVEGRCVPMRGPGF
jgi:hypothetical protein